MAGIKWKDGFKCLKCGHKKAQIRKDFSRTCNICSHHESATANTLFHKMKFGVRKAFFITFEMGTSTKGLSASYMGVRYGVTEKTARMWMHKVREAMESSGNNPMDGNVQVDEFVLGGREKERVGRSYKAKKKKAITAVELTDEGKVKRMYAIRIEDFSARSLQYIFVNHISRKVHTLIHQIKSWIRKTYFWVSDFNINRYFNEFCVRVNRSQSKTTIFNNLITRMVKKEKVYHNQIICN